MTNTTLHADKIAQKEFIEKIKHQFNSKKYSECLVEISKVLKKDGKLVNFSLVQMARTIANATLSKEDEKKFWKNGTPEDEQFFSESQNSLMARDFDKSLKLFRVGLSVSTLDDIERQLWLEVFERLVSTISYPQHTEIATRSCIQTIMVSGKGWSGSGAVYDYLSDFDEIYPIKGESHLIEGASSLSTLQKNIHNKELFINEFIRFFFISLFGRGSAKNASEFKAYHTTRKVLNRTKTSSIIVGINRLIQTLGNGISQLGGSSAQTLANLSESIVQDLILCDVPRETKWALLDNAIHAQNIKLFDLIKCGKIICTIRDLRSNYVALYNEYPGFHRDVNRYIKEESERMPKIMKSIAESIEKNNKSVNNVLLINFEDFVLNGDTREQLVKNLNLLGKKRDQIKFNPEVSKKNVFLHNEFIRPEEIVAIKNLLPQFCKDY